MSVFHFKQFSITQEKSAMKIGTDSVLLGCFCDVQQATRILDIGTGTGLLALMLAQKSTAQIDAVELDNEAAAEASLNFASSIWNNRIRLHHMPVQQFHATESYDIIISNPPYFRYKQQFGIADVQRSKARHDKDLPFEDLIKATNRLLSEKGQAWFILPVNEAQVLKSIAQENHLHLQQNIFIHSKPGTKHIREVLSFGKIQPETVTQIHFIIYDAEKVPTQAYRDLTAAFYLWKNSDNDERLK